MDAEIIWWQSLRKKRLKLEQFTSKSQRLIKDMELIIYLDKEYHKLLDELPDNIIIKDLNKFFL